MPLNPNDSENVTTVTIEMVAGWVFFKVADPKPEPSRSEFLLRMTIDGWVTVPPTFAIKKAMAKTDHGGLLGIDVWYDVTENRLETVKASGPVGFGYDTHHQIAAMHSREYIEAVVTDALTILSNFEGCNDSLLVVNPRKVAVILDGEAKRGAVIPTELIEQVVEGEMIQQFQAWLAMPTTPFYVTHLAGNWRSQER